MDETQQNLDAAGGADPSAQSPEGMGKKALHVFMNETGLRAGWRAALYFLLFALLTLLLFFPLNLLTHGKRPHGELSPGIALLGEGIQAIAIFGAAALMARIEHRRLLDIPFQGSGRVARFLFGLLWGFVALTALIFVLWKMHLLVFGSVTLHAGAAVRYGLVWAVMFLLVALAEEALTRGYLQSMLARGMGFWPAAILISLLFGALHLGNKGESHVGILSAALVGLLFSLSLWYTGSLWWAIGFHASWDWGQSFFYGTADSGLVARGHLLAEHPVGNPWLSGGATGPEGSPYVLLLILVVAFLCWAWWRRRPPVWPALASSHTDREPA